MKLKNAAVVLKARACCQPAQHGGVGNEGEDVFLRCIQKEVAEGKFNVGVGADIHGEVFFRAGLPDDRPVRAVRRRFGEYHHGKAAGCEVRGKPVVRQLELYGVEVHGSGQGSIRSKALVQLHGDARTAGIYSSGSSSREDVGRVCRKG